MAFLDHEGGAEFPYTRDDVFDALLEAIPTISGLKVHTADKLGGRVVAKAGVSLMSWGENIPISVSEISSGRTRVSITSTPKTGVLFGGALDLGKNRKNIERILEVVSQVLGQKPRVQPASPLAGTPAPAERIEKLKDLRDKGLITDAEFEKRNRRFCPKSSQSPCRRNPCTRYHP
jgi:hypothetical protein